jgi:hypothetical protein
MRSASNICIESISKVVSFHWIILNPNWTFVLEPKQQKWGYWYPGPHAVDITIIPRAVPDLEAPQQTGSSVNGGMRFLWYITYNLFNPNIYIYKQLMNIILTFTDIFRAYVQK